MPSSARTKKDHQHVRHAGCCNRAPVRDRCQPYLLAQPPTAVIYTLSLHDALPIFFGADRIRRRVHRHAGILPAGVDDVEAQAEIRIATAVEQPLLHGDRKSTRLNSSHSQTSYAVFCSNKKRSSARSSCWVL